MDRLIKAAIRVILVMMLFAIAMQSSLIRADGQAGTTLTADKTVEGHLTKTFQWTLDKLVNPALWELWRGDSGTSTYTIVVTKDEGTLAAWVDGTICITNGGAVATENLQIVDELKNGVPPPNDVIVSVNVDVSSNPILDPGETGCYSYHVDIPSGDIHPGGTYKNTANVTITNHSGGLGVATGPSPSTTTALPGSPTLIHDSITVNDTNGQGFAFNTSGSAVYEKTYTCDTDGGQQNNTATITFDDDGTTGAFANASVMVNCYALAVTKDAQTSFSRTYRWSIDKSANQSALTLALNQLFLVTYSVTVDVIGFTDSDWAVAGSIMVHNPAPIQATINSVSDVVSGVGAATVTCGVSFPHVLSAGGNLNCTYTTALPDDSTRTNTGTTTLQNYSYDSQLNATPTGTADFSGSATVDFGTAIITEIDECVLVDDTFAASLGAACVGEPLPKTFTYSRAIGPFDVCGDSTIDNIASFETNDTHSIGSDSWSVAVHVPCEEGCTLTIGYWKTHAGFGPQPDMVTPLLPVQLGSTVPKGINVVSAALAVQLLEMRGSNNVFQSSNGINKLYAQLLGARLNIANGADGSAISALIAASDALLASNDSTDWDSLTKPQKNQVLSWAEILDDYNNGLIGPGNCSE